MASTLYLVATPIGNLEDMTYRAVRILKEVDLIAAEDTRNSRHLLTHFDIHTPMTSYHEFNKIEKAEELLEKLLSGDDIAVITDAGTPGISDPGEELVRLCLSNNIKVSSVPGACAAVTALTMSGQSARRFAFEAFLPKDKKELRRVLDELKMETRTIIIYEAPHHLKKTLSLLESELGDRKLTITREITKLHEEAVVTTLSEAIGFYDENEPRGEYVLVLAGRSKEEAMQEKLAEFEGISLDEHMDIYLKKGMDKKEAMKAVAKDRGVSKREIYKQLNQAED
ncbi:MAG: 16S rRNA (cytidine(1402)-2'-O)-methyltransferase [Lachnospiraceae bacterium]|nr:16S rRNA (cytidine(1402)-2'-O)-methyltransferase [Lachnospiraceae bacterium]